MRTSTSRKTDKTTAPVAREDQRPRFKNPAWSEIDSEVGTLLLALQGLRSIEEDLADAHGERVAIEPNKAFVYEMALGRFIGMIESAAKRLDRIATEKVQ